MSDVKLNPNQLKAMQAGSLSINEKHYLMSLGHKPCLSCGKPSVARLKVFYPVPEYAKNYPEVLAGIVREYAIKGERVPTVALYTDAAKTNAVQHLKVWDEAFCHSHRKNAEGRAKQAPSYCCVEFNEAPNVKESVVGKPIISR